MARLSEPGLIPPLTHGPFGFAAYWLFIMSMSSLVTSCAGSTYQSRLSWADPRTSLMPLRVGSLESESF